MKNDKYFLDICNVLSSHSKCLSRKVGAIVVQDGSIISTGYNGPPREVPHCNQRYIIDKKLRSKIESIKCISNTDSILTYDVRNSCPRRILGYKSGEGLEYCVAGHGERNALINAAREGIRVKGGIMYMNCCIPCTPCLVEIINAGISEIVVTELKSYDMMSDYLIENSKLKVRVFENE